MDKSFGESGPSLVEVRQARYNPSFGWEHFDTILSEQGKEGFALLRLVPLDQWEVVAVFERRAADSGGSSPESGELND